MFLKNILVPFADARVSSKEAEHTFDTLFFSFFFSSLFLSSFLPCNLAKGHPWLISVKWQVIILLFGVIIFFRILMFYIFCLVIILFRIKLLFGCLLWHCNAQARCNECDGVGWQVIGHVKRMSRVYVMIRNQIWHLSRSWK